MTILVTGGAGYIGSHLVRQLGERNEKVVVLDNLATGFRSAVLHGEFVEGNSGDQALVSRLLKDHAIDTVMHFAAHTIVSESVDQPLKYYGNNTCATRNLLECCQQANVKQLVFSSTAAVYGIPQEGVASEDSPMAPISPYGMSKLMSEHMLRDLSARSAMKHVILRYFNVGGADPGCRIGHSAPTATLLTKIACQHMVGIRPQINIYGTDYATPDGTCVRDYIHVEDLAAAHLDALRYLREGGPSTTMNVGYGHGFSVRELLAAAERIHGTRFNLAEAPRRAGDPPVLIARADRVRQTLGWQPRFDNLDTLIKTQLAWERRLLAQPELLKN